MKSRTFITFEADFPDDIKFSESEDIERPGGHNIALAMSEIFTSRGLKVSDVWQRDYYGWEFSVKDRGLTVWLILQFGEPWLLLINNDTSIFRRLFGSKLPDYSSLLDTLIDYLGQDARFTCIQRFTEEEYNKSVRMRHEKQD